MRLAHFLDGGGDTEPSYKHLGFFCCLQDE